MAYEAYIKIKGSKQGQFKGEATKPQRQDQWAPIVAFTMGVESPRDAATGQAAGKRQYKPITIVKEWGASSPQLLAACSTNEVLTEVDLEFVWTNPAGVETVAQTVKLTNASISAIERFTGNPDGTPASGHSKASHVLEYERVSFVFQKIEVTDVGAKTAFADNWSAPA